MSSRFFVLSILLIWSSLILAQAPVSHITVDGFWLEPESELNSTEPEFNGGEILPNVVVYDLDYVVNTQIKLTFAAGGTLNHHLQLSVTLGINEFEMNFQNGEVKDETGNTIITSIEDLDVFHFELQSGQIAYSKNGSAILTKSVTEGVLQARYEQFSTANTGVVFEVEEYIDINPSMSGTLYGHVYFAHESPCSPTTVTYPVPGVVVNVSELDGSSAATSTTSAAGSFSILSMPSGMVKMNAYFDDDNHLTGIDQGDVTIIQAHIDGTAPLLCPLLRIAADVDKDGAITTLDRDIIQFHINNPTNPTPEIGINWWFVPIPYVYPTDYHPDLYFANQFWDYRIANASGQLLPFSSMLRYNNSAYTYLTPDQTVDTGHTDFNSWMNKLHEWMFDANPVCGEINWGFYMIRPGDLNGSSITDLQLPAP